MAASRAGRAGRTAGRLGRGFTLIEIMVVMLIIGILATFLSLAIAGRSTDDRLQVESDRLRQLIAFAAEQAQNQGVELGLRTTTDGIDFLSLTDNGVWQLIEDGTLRPRTLPQPFYVDLSVEGQHVAPVAVDREAERKLREDDEKKKHDDDAELKLDEKPKNRPQPQIFLLSSGDASAFVLDVKVKGYPAYYRLDCDILTRCSLQRQLERR